MTDYARLLHYVVPYWRRGVAAILAMILGALTTLAVPWIIRNIIDEVLAAKNLVALNWIALGILVLFFLRGVFSYIQGYLMSYIANRVIIDIRNEVYARVQRLSLRFFDTRKTGSLMSRLTNDIGALQTAIVDNFVNIVKESVILIGSLVGMVILHWRLTLLCIIIVPLVSITIKYFGRKLKKSGHMMQERIADVTSHLQETIGGIRVVKSFFREDYEIARFRQINQASFGAAMKAARQSSQLSPIVEFIAAIAVTAIIWYGGWSVIDGELTAGELIAFLIYAINLANPVRRLSALYGDIQRSMAAGERVFALLDETPDIREKADAIALPVLRGDVVFDAVHFQYEPSKEVLSGISFYAEPGQKIALVGPSGSGKSTIANLIPRFYDVTAGAIKIDGHDIRDVTLASLREQIGIVPQDTALFNTTIEENIRYGRLDATDEEVAAAVRAANAEEFVRQLPQGLQTPIGDRGLVLSGGQRQRIAIARALLKDPRILILDEATSALDTESEQLVQAALERLMIGRTAFIIAHRLTTIQDADHILVIDRGRIVESGTHQSLLALHGMYYNLYTLRLQGDEK
ncbi:lipid A export permease/ATP-binding protein MsbA [Negativicoccus succinicivorans]|uniref:lipid A export permease/ATP-binding protein MsbA n=1 Tax=Negativicoccus succinicivorans TaxID=620903 RepID=UPI0023558A02|nr:lipid A export permease/ATP-binding protein MsbA [Negativicoccus succinicivorans]MBS5890476.1 lipid A export permease/ATP-binding protein MsbA [Negativicoccus succinicivorans]MDU0987044.1 lipid A export permease/ATP-binding protein MsbA [Negativicoccus succinicivorans]MDU1066457.1 lipid A export permease/ATP-binding protein MsbA [Negativicoccus succinicivorans]